MSDVKKIDISNAISAMNEATSAINNTYNYSSNNNYSNTLENIDLNDGNDIESFIEEAKDFGSDFINKTQEIGNVIVDKFGTTLGKYEWYDDFNSFVEEKIVPLSQKGVDILVRTKATTSTFDVSVVEGAIDLVESLQDLQNIIRIGILSIPTGIYDGFQAIGGIITGEEWESVTKKLWDKTKAVVAQDLTTSFFDMFYDETKYGQLLKINSYGFDTTRSIGGGVGKVAGIVGISVASGGTLAPYTVAAMAGFGEGAEKSWAEGASTLEGLLSATLNSTWEGLQYYVGGKIGSSTLFGEGGKFLTNLGSNSIKANLLNSTSRVFLDSLDGGAEGFIQPLIATIYKDGYYDEFGNYIKFKDSDNFLSKYGEIFDDYGGVKNIFTNALVGGSASILGEAFNIGRFFDKSNTQVDIDSQKVRKIDDIHGYQANETEISSYYQSELFTKEDIEALMADASKVNENDFYDIEKVRDVFYKTLKDKMDKEEIDDVISKVNIIDYNEWSNFIKDRGLNENVLGFVDSSSEQLYFHSKANMHTVIHELFHKFAMWRDLKTTTPSGKTITVTGIKEFFPDGTNSIRANESLTEYLSSKYYDQKIYYYGYGDEGTRLWERIDNALYNKYGENDILLDSYLNNDSYTIRYYFDSYVHDGAYDELVSKMGSNSIKLKDIKELVSEFEKNINY